MARPKAARGARAEEREVAARSDLAAKHWWLAAAVSALDDHVYFGALHPGGRYEMLFSGPNLENLLGGRPAEDEDVVAIWQSRIEPDDLPAYKGCELELLAGRPAMVDYRVHGLDGKTRWVRARVHPEQLADGTVRFAGILSDITEQHEADDRLGPHSPSSLPRTNGWTRPTARRSSWTHRCPDRGRQPAACGRGAARHALGERAGDRPAAARHRRLQGHQLPLRPPRRGRGADRAVNRLRNAVRPEDVVAGGRRGVPAALPDQEHQRVRVPQSASVRPSG